MIKVSYQNKIWNLHQEDNTLILIDVKNESNILKIERKGFEDLLRENIIVFWDNYASKKQISSLTYFEKNKNISEKDKIKIEIIKKYIHIGMNFKKIDFCKYVKNRSLS